MKLSFKNDDKPTGLQRAISLGTGATILADKREVGRIYAPQPCREDGYMISLFMNRVPTTANPAPFEQRFFTKHFETLNEAKIFLRENWEKIQKDFALHQLD